MAHRPKAQRRSVRVAIEKLAHGGEGLGYLSDGRVVFVEGGLPGDDAEVLLTKEKKNWARGTLSRLHSPSKHRVAVECDAFKRGCGGCQFWGVSYKQELKWKADAAFEAMKRISKIELVSPEVVAADSTTGYRNRITVHQRREQEEIRAGFFAAGTNKVVSIQRCPVADQRINEALEEFLSPLSLLGNADIVFETAGPNAVVVLAQMLRGERIRHDVLELLSQRLEQGQIVQGIEIVDDRGKYFILGDTTVSIKEAMAESPAGSMRIKAGQFRQANHSINEKLVRLVTDVVAVREKKPRVLELFCGSGNFSFPVARVSESLQGYEGNPEAVKTAKEISELMEQPSNLSFGIADLSDADAVADLLARPADVLLLDPPREGANEVCRQVAASSEQPEQILYVSCDAACLARDLRTLVEGGYQVERLLFFDMFPRTAHLEVLAVLTR